MKLITKRSLIKAAHKRFTSSYMSKSYTDKMSKLDPETCTEDDIVLAVGNRTWTNLECDNCGKAVDAVVQVGQDVEYDSNVACVCLECLKKAVKIAKECK